MLINFLLSLTFLSCSILGATVDLPDRFTITERWFTVMTTFDIETPHQRIGYVSRKAISLLPEYTLFNEDNQIQAVAQMQLTLVGTTFNITSAEGKRLSTVNERLLSLFPTFDIVSPTGEVLGTARLNFLGTKYTLKDPASNQILATISRPFFRLWRDCWTVHIVNKNLLLEKQISLSEFALIAVFQTNREYWEERQKEGQKNGIFK